MRMFRLFVVALLCVGIASAQDFKIDRTNKTISITATDEASAKADLAVVSIGYEVFGPDSDAAYAEAAKRSQAIIDALHKAGINDKNIESQNQQVSRNMSFDQHDNEAARAARQFRASQSWTVKTSPDAAADILRDAIANGANQSGQIDWQLTNRKELQAQAAANALKKARAVAEQMAAGLGVKLGELIFASNDAPMVVANRMFGVAGGIRAEMKMAPPLVIRAQTVREEATVRAVFVIE